MERDWHAPKEVQTGSSPFPSLGQNQKISDHSKIKARSFFPFSKVQNAVPIQPNLLKFEKSIHPTAYKKPTSTEKQKLNWVYRRICLSQESNNE